MTAAALKKDTNLASFALEGFDSVIDEIKPLLELHWIEIAHWSKDIPLDPDFARYKALSDAGAMKIFTARMGGGLIGYAIYIISPKHPHYQTSCWMISDIVFVEPRHRNYGVGHGLMSFVEAQAREWGVDVLMTGTKKSHPELGFLLQSMGHDAIDVTYGKRLV